MRNKKPPNFSTHFEPETQDKINYLLDTKPFLTSKKSVIAYCVGIVYALEKEAREKENEPK